MAIFEIHISRGDTEGTLTFNHGGVSVDTTCWWDDKKEIPAGTYTDCSATISYEKKYKGIYIPDVSGYTGIFIHKGNSAGWSDGCIVIEESEILKIYDAISPKNGKNIDVTISDEK